MQPSVEQRLTRKRKLSSFAAPTECNHQKCVINRRLLDKRLAASRWNPSLCLDSVRFIKLASGIKIPPNPASSFPIGTDFNDCITELPPASAFGRQLPYVILHRPLHMGRPALPKAAFRRFFCKSSVAQASTGLHELGSVRKFLGAPGAKEERTPRALTPLLEPLNEGA